MSDASLARTLGVDAGNFCRYRKKGMPVDSLEAARAWLAANVRSYKKEREPKPVKSHDEVAESIHPIAPASIEKKVDLKNKAGEVVASATYTAEIPEIPAHLLEEDEVTGISRADLLKMRSEMRSARALADRMTKAMSEAKLHDESRKYSQLLTQIISRQMVIEREIRRLNDEDEVTITFAAANEVNREIVSRMKTLCNAMPANLAARVNPNDPVLARTMLEDWRNTFYKSLRESKFKETNEQEQMESASASSSCAA